MDSQTEQEYYRFRDEFDQMMFEKYPENIRNLIVGCVGTLREAKVPRLQSITMLCKMLIHSVSYYKELCRQLTDTQQNLLSSNEKLVQEIQKLRQELATTKAKIRTSKAKQ